MNNNNNMASDNMKPEDEVLASFDSWILANSGVEIEDNAKDNMKANKRRKSDNGLSTSQKSTSQVRVSDTSSLSSSSGSWFEPLESILSSGSSTPRSTSPNDDAVAEYIINNDVPIKVEEKYGEFRSGLPDFETLINEDDNSVTESSNNFDDSKKKRAPRKRLTSYQKQAHNKIEKRYRININTKIAKLQHIIPWVANEQTAFEVGDSANNQLLCSQQLQQEQQENLLLNNGDNSTKLNKSMILEKAVDYILYLQNNERLYEMEVQRLKSEIDGLK